MAVNDRKRSIHKDLTIAAAVTLAGIALSGAALAAIAGHNPMQLAQATPPLQSTPGAESKPSEPANQTQTGPRPDQVQPQPAQPGAASQTSGAAPALPPAPAEKTAPAMPAK